jgi:predicted ATPase
MKESIKILNFGPIKEVYLSDIRPLTILIGESGSGKSTILKILVLFRWIFKMVSIRSFLKQSGISKSPFNFNFATYIRNNGFEKFLKPDTDIEYTIGNCVIAYRDKKLSADNILDNAQLSLEKNCFISEKRNIIADMLSNKTSTSVAGFFLEETLNDYLEATKVIKELNFDYLGVKLVVDRAGSSDKYTIVGTNDDGDDFVINLEDASSGTQTVTPLSSIIEYYTRHYDLAQAFNKTVLNYLANNDKLSDFRAVTNIGEIENRRINFHIEEPELSLYPESQRSLINYIVNRCFVDKPAQCDVTVMMATHSPYIINHINLLVMAASKGVLEQGANICFGDVNVYEIIGGYLNDLKQDDAFVIDTRALSDPISNIYERLDELKRQ